MISATLSCGLSGLRLWAVGESWAEVGRGHATKSTGPEQAAQAALSTTMFAADSSKISSTKVGHTV